MSDSGYGSINEVPLKSDEMIPMEPAPTVIAFVNFKSGGRKGREVIKILERELGANCVYNLEDKNPGLHLEKYRGNPDLRVIACGGDGTVNWILSTVTRLRMEPAPSVSIIPLGTGNDTSRHFGWSHKLRDEKTVVKYINEMKSDHCDSIMFDRWQVFITVPKSKKPDMHPFLRGMAEISNDEYNNKASLLHDYYLDGNTETDTQRAVATSPTSVMGESQDDAHMQWSFNNYFSFGIDAQIMDSFHRHRERSPGCYCCRCCTMTWVGLWSPMNCCCAAKLPLKMDVEVLLQKNPDNGVTNGVDSGIGEFEWVKSTIDAQQLDAFILLNLPTYAGGRNIWGTDNGKITDRCVESTAPSTTDGKLEVLGFESYTHMSIAVGLQATRAHRLHQVMGIRFNIKDNMYIQLDGEAWMQDCGTIEIFRAPSVRVLKNRYPDQQGKLFDC